MANQIIFVSLGRNGGLPKYAAHIAQHLMRSNHLIHSITAIGSEHPIEGAKQFPTYNSMITLIASSLFILPLLCLYVCWLVLFKNARHLYFPYVHTWTPPLILVARLCGCETVVTFHDYKPHLGESNRLTRLLLWFSARLTHKFVFLSNHVRDEAIADRPCIINRSTVIPHGIFRLPQLEEKFPLSLKQDNLTFLFLGRISPYKGVEMLAEAFSKLQTDGCRLIIAGKSNYAIQLPNKLKGMEFLDRYLDESEMAHLINDSDVLVLPYLESTQSGIVTLGIASATPMICTTVGGLIEQLSSKECIFCDASTDSLTLALETALSATVRKDLCESLISKKQELSWELVSKDIWNFIFSNAPCCALSSR